MLARISRGVIAFLLVSLFSLSPVWGQGAGQPDLDKATDMKLEADSIEKLTEVIKLCETAIEKGLDDGDKDLAKQLISSSALERAQLITQRMTQGRMTPRNVQAQRDQAMKSLDLAIENDPKMAEAYILKAKLYTVPEPDRPKAIEAVTKAIELLSENPEEQGAAYMLRAGITEKIEDKLADITKATEVNPANTEAWQLRIGLLDGLGKSQEAYEASTKLMEREPDNLVAMEAAVRALVRLEKVDDAIALITKRIESMPDAGMFYRLRGQLYRSQQKDDEALADLNKAIDIDTQDAMSLMMRGEIYLDKNEVEKARKDIDGALDIEPNLVQGILMRSLVAAREERFDDAIADMRKLVRNQPDNPFWMLQLASYYQLDNRPRMSIKVADEVLKLDENNWRAYRLRSDAQLSISEHAEAIKGYEKALEIIEKATKPAADGQGETATIVVDDDDKSGILNNLAWVLATSPKDEVRDGKKSLEYGLKACELTKYEESHILSTLAAGYAETGDFENAKKWSEKAVELGKKQRAEQIEQLEKELESYKNSKPWREEQKQQENEEPIASGDKGIDT